MFTGISRLRGVVMYELQSTLSTYARRKYSSGEISLEHLKNILKVRHFEKNSSIILTLTTFVLRRKFANTWKNAFRSSVMSLHAFKKAVWQPLQDWTSWNWKHMWIVLKKENRLCKMLRQFQACICLLFIIEWNFALRVAFSHQIIEVWRFVKKVDLNSAKLMAKKICEIEVC